MRKKSAKRYRSCGQFSYPAEKKICRAAIDYLFITANLLSEVRINLTRSFTVFTCNHILEFLGNHLVTLTKNYIEY